MNESSPKRRYPRLGTQKLVIISQVDEDLRKEPSHTLSMGPGGLSLEMREELPVGALLRLHVSLGAEVVRVDGRVAYCRPLSSDSYEIGVEFTELEPKLIQLLERQAALDASIYATSLAVEITRFIAERRAEEPKISHLDCLAALELIRLRLEERAAQERDSDEEAPEESEAPEPRDDPSGSP